MSSVSPFGSVSSDVSPALLPLATQQAVNVSNSVTGISGWTTGDYKVSALAADHADAGGGQWLICDGTAIDAQYAGLIATVGANRPDARGRTLVMKGSNASAVALANDGQAEPNRRSYHRTSLTDAGHVHGGIPALSSTDNGGAGAGNVSGTTNSSSATTGITVGTGIANDALDTPSFIVPGSLFIHT